MISKETEKAYADILIEELIPAMGCTEPIAIAFAAAKVQELLSCEPESVDISVSGNIIKNVKSVIVPNTGGLKGIETSVAAGIISADASLELEVLKKLTPADRARIKEYRDTHEIRVFKADNSRLFYIKVTAYANGHTAQVVIADFHTNIVHLQLDGAVLMHTDEGELAEAKLTDRSVLCVEKIIEYAECTDIENVRAVIKRQIDYNSAIAKEGLRGEWGAQIGRTILATYGDDIKVRARAVAAAGSDARMSGCEMPVIIVSGSGNQGMTASLPVIEYASDLGSTEDELIRALIVSNLITIHQKTGIGRLSAFCGAVSAACGAASGIAYLLGGRYDAIAHTIVNTLAVISGMVCDGAKPSCAAKIAVAVDMGILGYSMYKNGREFLGGDGIVLKGVENTITSVGRLARDGMRDTDREILEIMKG